MKNWLKLFISYHNYVRDNEEDGRPPLRDPSKPEYQRFIDTMMGVMSLRHEQGNQKK